MKKLTTFVLEAKKTVTAAVGALAMVLGAGILPDPERGWAVALLAFLTTVGVYKASNQPAK